MSRCRRTDSNGRNLPSELLDALRQGLDANTVADLTRVWGSRPQLNFVENNRELLLHAWLAKDDSARRAVVGQLRTRGLGECSSHVRSRKGELTYLRSCRNMKGFQRIVLDEFISLGEVPMSGSRGWRLIDTTGQPPSFEPYAHQTAAWDALNEHRPLKGGLLVLPTGAGKTVTAVRWILKHVLSEPKPRPVLWLAHRSELLDQAAETFALHASAADRGTPIGIRCISSLHGNSAYTMLQPADVVCATDASLGREPEIVSDYFLRHRDAFVVIDEAHHAAARRYQQLLAAARRSRRVEVLGLTATPTRTIEGELGLLHRAFPQGILYSVEPAQLIASGILAQPICETVSTGLDFERDLNASELRYLSRYRELAPATLQRIAEHTSRNVLIANRYEEFKASYGQTLVFATSVAHCYTLADELRSRGVAAGYVAYQRDDHRTNEQVLADFKASRIDVLMTVTKLTEGIDLPDVGTIFLARPTGSRILLSQMVGRGMRGPRARGTEEVRVVSFDDHWERFTDWLDPVEFLNAPITDRPDRDPVTTEMVDIPWNVYLEIARKVRRDPGQVRGVENRPVGWYDLTALPLPIDGRRSIVVFHSQRDGYEHYIGDLLGGEVDAGDSTRSLLDWYFSSLVVQPPLHALQTIRDFVDSIGAAPPFYPFEVMRRFAPETVAESVKSLTIAKATERIHRIHDEQPVVRALFPDRRVYAETVFDAILDLRFGPEHFTEHTAVDLSEHRPDLPRGRHDLEKVAAQVRTEMGLAAQLPGIAWSPKARRSYWAIYYPNPAEITVNSVLKTSAIRRETMAYLIFHELLHHELGVEVGHGPEFRDRERQFPGWAAAAAELDTLEERFRVRVEG